MKVARIIHAYLIKVNQTLTFQILKFGINPQIQK
jgi:hypothetical protein